MNSKLPGWRIAPTVGCDENTASLDRKRFVNVVNSFRLWEPSNHPLHVLYPIPIDSNQHGGIHGIGERSLFKLVE